MAEGGKQATLAEVLRLAEGSDQSEAKAVADFVTGWMDECPAAERAAMVLASMCEMKTWVTAVEEAARREAWAAAKGVRA